MQQVIWSHWEEMVQITLVREWIDNLHEKVPIFPGVINRKTHFLESAQQKDPHKLQLFVKTQ